MNRIGFHCSHEQHAPSALLRLAAEAERAGFEHAMCSDHFQPWSDAQGHSGFAWSWLGAALHRTGLSFGTVCAPGQRYHPAIVAQAAATLCEMCPDRFWIAVGSGEALNEGITGDVWPAKEERNARLLECVQVMRALWRGETVTHDGRVRVHNARLYSRPARLPLLLGAALTEATARWAASWADGLITVAGDRDAMRRVLAAFRDHGGASKPVFLQVCIAFGRSDDAAALEAVEQWRQSALDPSELASLASPHAFERAGARLPADSVLERIRVSGDLARQREWIEQDLAMGFDRVYLHNVVRNHDRFFDACAGRVLGG